MWQKTAKKVFLGLVDKMKGKKAQGQRGSRFVVVKRQ